MTTILCNTNNASRVVNLKKTPSCDFCEVLPTEVFFFWKRQIQLQLARFRLRRSDVYVQDSLLHHLGLTPVSPTHHNG